MATPKKSQNSTKTKTSSAAKSATKTTKPTEKPSVKPSSKPASTSARSSKPAAKKQNTGRIVALVVGIVALVAVVATIIIYLCFGNGSMTTKTTSGTKVETTYVDFADGAFRVKIPTELSSLSNSELTDIYGSSNKPTAVYSNSKQDVGVVVNITDTALSNDQVEPYLETMITLLESTGTVSGNNLYKTQGHDIGAMELTLESTDKDEDSRYDHMAFFSLDDKLVIVTFETAGDLREEWKPVGEFVIKSINFTK